MHGVAENLTRSLRNIGRDTARHWTGTQCLGSTKDSNVQGCWSETAEEWDVCVALRTRAQGELNACSKEKECCPDFNSMTTMLIAHVGLLEMGLVCISPFFRIYIGSFTGSCESLFLWRSCRSNHGRILPVYVFGLMMFDRGKRLDVWAKLHIISYGWLPTGAPWRV